MLTRFVVSQALDELLDQDGRDHDRPSEILDLTICEPALGSGAFLNEAINQLAGEYLRRRQDELGETIDPDRYHRELQKVKAHLALHQCYGVDLNATAVELAEVSLWLNCMHPGLEAPWFGLHLRRGNSLIGARRAVYAGSQITDRSWLKTPPTDRRAERRRPSRAARCTTSCFPAAGWAAPQRCEGGEGAVPGRGEGATRMAQGRVAKADAARAETAAGAGDSRRGGLGRGGPPRRRAGA